MKKEEKQKEEKQKEEIQKEEIQKEEIQKEEIQKDKKQKEETQDEKKEDEKRKHVPMTDEEIKKLAEDMYKGFVFTDRHLNSAEELPMVFLPLALMSKEHIEELQKNAPGMIYEYVDRAGPMGVNGMPMFTSFRIVSIEDTKKIFDHYNKIKEAVASV